MYVVYRRTADEMPAAAEEVAEAEAEGVQFKNLMPPAEVLGEEAVTGLKLQCMELSAVEDASGRRQPVERKGVFEELAVVLELAQGVVADAAVHGAEVVDVVHFLAAHAAPAGRSAPCSLSRSSPPPTLVSAPSTSAPSTSSSRAAATITPETANAAIPTISSTKISVSISFMGLFRYI